MTERRPHWSDDLIDAVRDAVDVEFDDIWKLSEDSILAVIAAVEDWEKDTFTAATAILAERIKKAEVAIQRVREQAGQDTVYPGGYADGWYSAMQTILLALDGAS